MMRNKKNIIIAIIIGVIIIAAVAIILIIQGKNSENETNTNASTQEIKKISTAKKTQEDAEVTRQTFNLKFTPYVGTGKTQAEVTALLNVIIENNSKEDGRTVVLSFDRENVTEPSEIQKKKDQVFQADSFVIDIEYDLLDYVEKVIVVSL